MPILSSNISPQMGADPVNPTSSSLTPIPELRAVSPPDVPVFNPYEMALNSFPDVKNIFGLINFKVENLPFISESDIVQIINNFETDSIRAIVLKSNILSLQTKISSISSSNSNSNGESSFGFAPKLSTFGHASFPSKSTRPRDVTKWSPILGRKYRGICDDLPVSSFCNMLISFGIRESMSSTEFFKFVLNNIESDLTVKIVNHLISRGCIDDSSESRLSELYAFMKLSYGITDSPCILQSRLEKLRQESMSITEFSQLFSKRLDEVRSVQSENPLTDSYVLSVFKSCLHERYRIFADDQVAVKNFDHMVDSLMIWEKNIESREGKLPNSKSTKEKIRSFVVQKDKCGFCKRSSHTEEHCWKKFPEQKPPVCDKCGKPHHGQCKPPRDHPVDSKFSPSAEKVVKTTLASIVSLNTTPLLISEPWAIALHRRYNLEPIVDSGASCSMVSIETASSLLNAFSNSGLVELEEFDHSPLYVEFGDKQKVCATQSLIIHQAFQNEDVKFLIVPKLSVPILLGLSEIDRFKLSRSPACSNDNLLIATLSNSPKYPTAPELSSLEGPPSPALNNSATESPPSSPSFETRDVQFFTNSKNQIEVSCPIFENASVLPWREKSRSRSEVELKIVDKLLEDMLINDQIRQVSPDEILVVQEILLVDKWTAKGIFKPKTFPPEEGRYRLPLDCRPANALRYDSTRNSWIVNNLLFGANQQSQTNEIRQSQRSALSQIESIPRSSRRHFAKIDLKNAFYSTHVTDKLSKLFGFKHRDQYFAMKVLPMGWFLSSLIFQDVVSYVLKHCDLNNLNVFVRHQQDDILIVGEDVNNVENAMNLIIDKFRGFNFDIKLEKCEKPQDSVIYCGLKLFGDGSVKPWPVKRQLTEVAAQTASELFSRCKTAAETKRVLRSWLGTANYFNKWLPNDLRSENLYLHSLLSKLDNGEISRHEISEKAINFVKQLCYWWLNNSYGLYGGSSSNEDTLVVTDANSTGWSGCIFRLVEVSPSEHDCLPLPFSLEGLLSSHQDELIPRSKTLENFTIVPVRFDGARWETQFHSSQSSTWKERSAAMLIVHRNRECLSGKVFILSDNKNLVGNWRDVESLTSTLCSPFLTYISHVHGAIHVKRSHPLIQWVDNSARNLSVTLNIKRVADTRSVSLSPKRTRLDFPENSISSEDEHSECDSESLSSEPNNSPDDNISIIGHHDLNTLLEKGYIEQHEQSFYTTEKFPGNVVPGSFLIPSQDALSVLKNIHLNYGHPTISGIRKILTLWKLWIVNFKSTVKQVLDSCQACLLCRDTYHPERSSIPMSQKPMQMIMLDFFQSVNDLQPAFIMVRDRFSGFTEGRAIEQMDQLEVKQLLTEWIARFGPPAVVLTDNAEAFKSELMRKFYDKYSICHKCTPVYNPQGNGSVERTIKSIEEGLPIELFSGIPAQEAIHIVCGRLNRTSMVPGSDSSLCPRSSIFSFDENHPFNPKLTPTLELKHDLNPGDPVLLRIPNASKLDPQFEDKNLFVHSVEGNHIYSLRDSENNVLKNLFRRDRLKPKRACTLLGGSV